MQKYKFVNKIKKLLLLTLVLLSVNIFAQTEKNKIFLSGSTNASLYFIKTESTDNETTNINIYLTSGLFIKNNVVLGASFSFSQSKMSNTSYNYGSETTVYQIAPFLRVVFPK